ncbi:MAG: nucleoside hydrolase [Chitinophagaceae bacterium]
MIYKILLCSAFLLSSVNFFGQSQKPVSIIFDSDMGPDYDDVGAIALLHAYADSGYINILATVASTKYEGVAAVFHVLNTYFNRPELPIGVPKRNGLDLRDWQHWTDTLLANYPHAIKSNDEVPEAVEVYRKILASQPDKSVTIVTVGFLTNLAGLLKSPPDAYSRLTGKELVLKKVKTLISMAGKFPSGKEFNVEKDAAASQMVFTQWPTPVILSGFEIGQKIKTGLPLIHNDQISNSPVKDVFRISIPMDKQDKDGRMSWDETAVLIAAKGHAPYYTLHKGTMEVAPDGSNTWKDGGTRHAYLVEKIPAEQVQHIINTTMMHQPVKH